MPGARERGAWHMARLGSAEKRGITPACRRRQGYRRDKLWAAGLLAAALLLTSSTTLSAAPPGAPEAAPSPPPAPHPPEAIPEAEVATRASEVPGLLRALSDPLAPSVEVHAIERRLPQLRRQNDVELAAAPDVLRGQPTLDILQAQQQMWQRRQLLTTTWLEILTQRATQLQQALTRLEEIRAMWRRTREAAATSRAPGPLLLQIDGVLSSIEAAEAPLDATRTAVLDLQTAVAQEVARTGSALAQFAQAQQAAMGGMLARDTPPLWSQTAWGEARATSRGRLREIIAHRWADIVGYAEGSSRAIPWHLAGLALLLVVLSVVRQRARRSAGVSDGESASLAVFEYPYSATAAVALLILASPYSALSGTVRRLLVVLGLGAVIKLTQAVADPILVPEFYMLWALFAVDSVRETLAGVAVVEQALLVLEMLAGILLIAYALRRGALRHASAAHEAAGRLASYRAAARLLVLVFAIAGVAGALGYMRLARLFATGTLGCGALALTLYASIRVVNGLAAFALRAWPLRQLQMVRLHRALLEHRILVALIWAAAIGWIMRSLDFVGLFQPAVALVETVLAAKLGRGAIQLTVGDLLEFLFTIWLAYVISAFVRFVLREDIYPRTRLTRGISYAISSLLNYVIIALGFVLALGALGLDLNKVTVLAGAFGVGIGFGLQSVVNNFVSGLILLFERPIHVGDVIEIGDRLSGEVRRIGIRASTVRTGQGAEIIVPNAQLITERVTNWTLSDRTRRIDLRVGVDYGSSPEKVLAVLEAVGRAHPGISKTPPPTAAFIEFADSAITFELRAWTSQFERWGRIQTELATALYTALREAGMSIPFPQREVHFLNDGREPAPPNRPR